MSQIVFGTGLQIYQAAVAGAHIGYNRSTDDHSKYEKMLDRHYRLMLANVQNRAERREIRANTKNSWRKAYLPLALALVHRHIGGQPCEEHARVYLTSDPATVFDIPMFHWNVIKRRSESLFSK